MTRHRSATPLAEEAWERLQTQAWKKGPDYSLFQGDSLKVLSQFPAGSIHTCLTSPPYWSVRDYEHEDQVGLESEVEEYVGRLVRIMREVRRVLVEKGTVWLNVGDCYYHGCGTVEGRPPPTGWKRNKQLVLVPFRLALALQEDGWWVRNTVVWNKPNSMPSSVRDRLTNAWEPVFLLSKEEHYYFDLDAIRVPHATDDTIERRRAEVGQANGKAKGREELRRWLNSPRHRATIDGLKAVRRRPNAPDPVELAAYMRRHLQARGGNLDWVAEQLGIPFERARHYFRTDRIGSRLPPEDTWERLRDLLDLDTTFDEAMATEVGDNVFRNHPKGRNPGDVQAFALSGGSNRHFATMPLSLATWALRATLPPGGVCLDPFMGIGTTGMAARGLGGRFVGIDIRHDFLEDFDVQARRPRVGSSDSRRAG